MSEQKSISKVSVKTHEYPELKEALKPRPSEDNHIAHTTLYTLRKIKKISKVLKNFSVEVSFIFLVIDEPIIAPATPPTHISTRPAGSN